MTSKVTTNFVVMGEKLKEQAINVAEEEARVFGQTARARAADLTEELFGHSGVGVPLSKQWRVQTRRVRGEIRVTLSNTKKYTSLSGKTWDAGMMQRGAGPHSIDPVKKTKLGWPGTRSADGRSVVTGHVNHPGFKGEPIAQMALNSQAQRQRTFRASRSS